MPAAEMTDKDNPDEARELRDRAWELYVKGADTRTIGRQCRRSQAWASLVIRDLINSRNEDTRQSVRGHLEKLIDELNLIRQAAWKGWERSRKDKVKRTEKACSGGEGGDRDELTTSSEGQAGDSSFLRVLLECGRRESALRGIEKPTTLLFNFMQTHVDLDALIEQVETMRIQEESGPALDPVAIECVKHGEKP